MINLDNGVENNSRRTQFIKRLVEFSNKENIEIELAYYPPYHSKYNKVERCWGILEKHWNGNLLETVETALNFAKTMTWKGKKPIVKLVDKVYQTGVSLEKKVMANYEKVLERLEGLEKYFVKIRPCSVLN